MDLKNIIGTTESAEGIYWKSQKSNSLNKAIPHIREILYKYINSGGEVNELSTEDVFKQINEVINKTLAKARTPAAQEFRESLRAVTTASDRFLAPHVELFRNEVFPKWEKKIDAYEKERKDAAASLNKTLEDAGLLPHSLSSKTPKRRP